MIVNGGIPLVGTEVNSCKDHRVAMALVVAGMLAKGKTKVKDAQCASVTFPSFFDIMNKAGAGIVLED
jgi:3-phosphoshikimate 1-carboxyvinyltransferase